MQSITREILYIGIYVVLCAVVPALGSIERCEASKGRKYVENSQGKGRCEDCPECGIGEEWDKSVKLPSSDYGDTECYPCIPCKEGFYRDEEVFYNKCNRCFLNCTTLNRLEGRPCSKTTRGHCNSCLPGYTEIIPDTSTPCARVVRDAISDTDSGAGSDTGSTENDDVGRTPNADNNDLDTEGSRASDRATGSDSAGVVNRTVPKVQSAQNTTIKSMAPEPTPSTSEFLATEPVHNKQSKSSVGIWLYLVLLLGAMVMIPLIVCICIRASKKCRNKHALPCVNTCHITDELTDSNGKLMIGTGSSFWQNFGSVKTQREIETPPPHHRVEGDKFQTDCPDVTESYTSLLENKSVQAGTGNKVSPILLHKNHGALTCVASKTIPDNVSTLFHCLNLHPAVWKPERELFYIQKQTYKDFVLNALIKWTQQAGKKATLDVLLHAAEEAGIHDAVEELKNSCRPELSRESTIPDDTHVNMEATPLCLGEQSHSKVL